MSTRFLPKTLPLFITSAMMLGIRNAEAQDYSAAAAAVGRSTAAVANPSDGPTEGPAAPAAPLVRRPGGIVHEKPEDVHFQFKPPATTRRKGHPTDREITLTEEELGRLNVIGEALVEFVDSEHRIETNQTAYAKAMLAERDKETVETANAFAEAQRGREKAQIDVLDVRDRLKEAKRTEADKRAAFDKAQEQVAKLKQTIQTEIDDIDALNQSVRKMEEDIAQSVKKAESARLDAQKNAEKTQEMETALKIAQKDLADTTNALSMATAEAARWDQKVEDLRKRVKAASEDRAAKERALSDAEDAAGAAVRADEDASRATSKAEKALRKALEMKAETEARKAEADRALSAVREAAKPTKPDGKPGFWARRALRKAEARAKKAAEALPIAEAAAADAEKARKAASEAKSATAKVRGEKESALDAAKTARAGAEKALADAKKAAKTAESDTAKAHKEVADLRRKAESLGAEIQRAGARLDESQARDKVLAEAAKKAEETVAPLEARLKEIDAAANNENKANLVHETEMRELEVAAGRALDEWKEAQGKVIEVEKLDTPEIHAALDEANRVEGKAREAYRLALARQNSISSEAAYAAQQDEKDMEVRLEKDRDEFWDMFRLDKRDSAPNVPSAALAKADQAMDAARNAVADAESKAREAATALAEAREKRVAADKVKDAAAAAVKASNRTVANAERKAGAAADAAVRAAKALDDARAAVEGASDAEKATAVVKAAETKKSEADVAKAEVDRTLADAKADAEKAAAAFAEAETAARAAELALAKATDDKGQADGGAKAAGAALRQAESAQKVARRDVDGAQAETDRAVNVLVEAFDAQVAEARRRKLDAIRWITLGANERDREDARKARKAYYEARRAYVAARKELAAQRGRYVNKEIRWDTQEYVIARGDYAEKRAAFEAAEDLYNRYFSDSHTFHIEPLADEEADALYETEEALRALHGVQFRGDRRWLARTSVNGEPLLESFFGEMEWQAEQVGERDTEDPSKVSLTPEQTLACARAAAANVQRRAVYGGFYFAGLEVEDTDDGIVCLVDKGRYGPLTVEFVRPNAENPDESTSDVGRMFNGTNILAKLGSKAGDTNALDAVREGEAFNFIEFRKNFNALNAHPDIEKADVEFRPEQGFDYGFEAEDEEMGTNRTTRAIAGHIKVTEKPWPAPLHGVLAIDNFNSMGDPGKPMGEPDTYMARLTLQTLDLWGLGHALTLNGNVSLGGSLYGGAASYFIPREEDSSWADGSWHRLSGWSWTLHGGYTWLDQDDVLTAGTQSLDVLGEGYYGGLQATSRLADFEGSALDFSLGVTYRYVESSLRINDQEIQMGPNDGDGYEILPFSAALLYADKRLDDLNGRNYATIEAVYNLGGSSSSDLYYFRQAIKDDRYLLARLQLARLQLLPDTDTFLVPRMLFLRADAQWASTPVIGSEQYGLGGHGTVRGYVEREFMGDNGASGTIEFRTPIGLGYFDTREANAYQAADRLQLVYFLDLGWYELQKVRANAGGGFEDDSEFIAGAGLGLRYSYDDFVLRFDWGVPINRKDAKIDTSSAGVGHLSLQYQF